MKLLITVSIIAVLFHFWSRAARRARRMKDQYDSIMKSRYFVGQRIYYKGKPTEVTFVSEKFIQVLSKDGILYSIDKTNILELCEN